MTVAEAEIVLDIGFEGGLLTLEGQQVIGIVADDLIGDFDLAVAKSASSNYEAQGRKGIMHFRASCGDTMIKRCQARSLPRPPYASAISSLIHIEASAPTRLVILVLRVSTVG